MIGNYLLVLEYPFFYPFTKYDSFGDDLQITMSTFSTYVQDLYSLSSKKGVYLVLHGASGVPQELVKVCIIHTYGLSNAL